MSNLSSYNKDGLELVIDNSTGECFASQSATARMCEVDESTIRRFVTSAQMTTKLAEVLTPAGLRSSALLDENQIIQCVAKYNPQLGLVFMRAGLRVYLHQEAGYKVTSTAVEQRSISAEPEVDAARAVAMIHESVNHVSPRIVQYLSDLRLRRLANELGLAALPPVEAQLMGVVEIAEDLGYRPTDKHWSSLGRAAAKAFRDAGLGEPQTEKRLCNGRMTTMKVYPSTEPVVLAVIHSFYKTKVDN